MGRARSIRVSAGAVVVGLGLAPGLGTAQPVHAPVAPPRPSFVLIVTDDQRWDTLRAMPIVREKLKRHGVTFARAFVVNPLCCPSRASILTGLDSEGTDVYRNAPRHGGFESFDGRSTVATWLDQAGYRTGFFGKYLNGYEGTHVPPGWDRWVAFSGARQAGRYFDYRLNVDGALRSFGSQASDYSTDVLAAKAETFIRNSHGPLMVLFAPTAPHAPSTPAPRHASSLSGLSPWRPPNYDEPNVADKPAWVRRLPRFDAARRVNLDRARINQYRSLKAVDEAVGRLVDALADTGRLGKTLVVFTSDNGLSWGEHRWSHKMTAYEENIRVPMVVRYDRLISTARTDRHLALNIDLAPTMAAIAGIDAPPMDGTDLSSVLAGRVTGWRRNFAIEHLTGWITPSVPTYCAVRTGRFVYVSYKSGERELYDLSVDPYERFNKSGRPAYADEEQTLQALLDVRCGSPPTVFTLP
jgi:N-acetylglucosamine-6-sulfatase